MNLVVSGEIYIAGKNFTLPPGVTAVTNSTSVVGMMMNIIVRVVMTMLIVGMVMNIMVMMTEADQVCNNQAAKPLFL